MLAGFLLFPSRCVWGWYELIDTNREAIHRTVNESQENDLDMIQHSPDAILIHEMGKLVYLNTAAAKLLGVSNAEELHNHFVHQYIFPVEKNVSSIQLAEAKLLQRDGALRDIEIVYAPIIYQEQPAVQMRIRETADKQLQNERELQEKLMHGILEATNHLLIEPDHIEAINGALAILGNTVKAERICIFENDHHPPPDKIHAILRFEWLNPEQEAKTQLLLNDLWYHELGFMRWYHTLADHLPISGLVKEFPESERIFLSSLGIVSLLAVPIFIKGTFWGFIGFFDSEKERRWSPKEQAILMTMANGIGGAIQRIRTEKKLRRSLAENDLLATAIANTTTGVLITNPHLPDNPIIFVNQAFTNITGYTTEEVLYKNPRFLTGEKTDPLTIERIRDAIEKKQPINVEICSYKKDKTPFWNEVRISPVKNDQGDVLYYVGFLSDVTERKQDTEQLKLYAKVVENTQQGVLITDKFANIVWGNTAFSAATGYTIEEVIGKNPRIFQSGLHSVEFYKQMWLSLQQTGQWQGEVWNRRKNGEAYVEWINISTIVDENGEIANYVAVFSDITERKRFEQELREANEKLRHLSSVDGLTEIANRRSFDEMYQREWARSVRNETPLSVIMIDIDDFKVFNDTYGHQQGDESLRIVAKTLATTLKRPTDIVARYGGEEFVIVLPQTDLKGAQVVAEQLREQVQALRIPHINSKSSQHLSISLGVASTIPTLESNQEELLHKADQALYLAKRQGGNRVCLMQV